uniref:Uncharacterized protein n=1 Tax=Tetraselmis sp. GSL018 TaxID=582737 RepID=A0A061RDZ4_9CHLO
MSTTSCEFRDRPARELSLGWECLPKFKFSEGAISARSSGD